MRVTSYASRGAGLSKNMGEPSHDNGQGRRMSISGAKRTMDTMIMMMMMI